MIKVLVFSLFLLIVGFLVFKELNGSSSISKSQTWIYPDQKGKEPVWGHKNGIRIGIAPAPGPRGLIRIYAPYLGLGEQEVFNFLAIEPILKGASNRGFSEMEMSTLDDVRGKRFWSSNDSLTWEPSTKLVEGLIEDVEGDQTLTIFIFSEAFDNGAKTYVRIRFFKSRPYEFEVVANALPESAELEHLIITATMGNFARLRKIHLEESTKLSMNLWPDYRGTAFTDHDYTSEQEMIHDSVGSAYFIASSNEVDLAKVVYPDDTKAHWKYQGRQAVQYWKKKTPPNSLMGLVNGRYTYWASKSPIPGGISFENFELVEPFRNGSKYIYGASPQSSGKFISEVKEKGK